MKICFPIINNEGLKSQVNVHFGSTKDFLIYDSDTKEYEVVSNADAEHAHGMCQPLKALQGKKIDVVIVGGVGMGALQKLKAMSITVCRAVSGSVNNNLQLFQESKLAEINANDACSGHGDCGHSN